MTLREALQKHYPQHIDRIIELANEQQASLDIKCTDDTGPSCLLSAFYFGSTKEGHAYWWNMIEKAEIV
jgi:hypothetical protein